MTNMEEFGVIFSIIQLLMNFLSLCLNIAAYVLTALAMYTIAKRRGISKPWLAWIPVANTWTLGCISDQYRYVVKGETKSKRKILLGLNIALYVSIVVLYVGLIYTVIHQVIGSSIDTASEAEILRIVFNSLSTLMLMLLPMMAISITYQVIFYMALYDVYRSCDPNHSVLFLVLSILFSVTTPFFLFFSRKKDFGMPPRKWQPTDYMPQPNRQNWESYGSNPEIF